uniref:peptidylprolyl isomerase n=1 Tax=Variovorax sp. BK018 TaxID=3450241 RepID=UPI0040396357
MRGESEYNVRHIMVRSKDQAEAALARVHAGESFGAVANAVSLDEGSNRKGGELGWNLGAHFTPEFSVAMTALGPAGIVDSPVHTPFGWHIIEVTGMRPLTMPPFEELRAQLAQRLRAAKAGQ